MALKMTCFLLLSLMLAVTAAAASGATLSISDLEGIAGGCTGNTAVCDDVWCLGVSSDMPCGPLPGCDCFMYAQWVTEVASLTGGNDINAGTTKCCSKWDCDVVYEGNPPIPKSCGKTSSKCGNGEHPDWEWGGTYVRCIKVD